MTSVALWLTFPLLASNFRWTMASSQDTFEMKAETRHQSRGSPQHRSKRDVEPVSGEYISDLWSDIENAFRYLEDQPETPARERMLLEDLQRSRKNEKVSRLPFTQHNFIRFGKRSDPSQETQGLSSQPLLDGPTSSTDLQDILSLLRDSGLVQVDDRLSETSYPLTSSDSLRSGLTETNVASDNKRQVHNFVRFGKRSVQNDNNEKRQVHNFVRFGKRSVQNDNNEKREAHNFVRFGKRFQQNENREKRQHNFVRFGKRLDEDENTEKREQHTFVRFGKRLDEDENTEKREQHNFVRFGKRLEDENTEKREQHKFVRFGRTIHPITNALPLESTNDRLSIILGWY